MDEGRAYELGPEELGRLLAEAIEADPLAADAEAEAEPPAEPVDRASRDRARRELLSALLDRPCDRISVLQGKSTGELLLADDTDPSIFRIIKGHGKEMVRRAHSKTERDVGITLYYAAIAGALVCHGKKISDFSHAALARSLGTLAAKRWLPEPLVELFRQAHRYCAEQPADTSGPTDLAP